MPNTMRRIGCSPRPRPPSLTSSKPPTRPSCPSARERWAINDGRSWVGWKLELQVQAYSTQCMYTYCQVRAEVKEAYHNVLMLRSCRVSALNRCSSHPLHHINFSVGCQLLGGERAEFVDEGGQERPTALNVGSHGCELRGHGDGKHPGNISAMAEKTLTVSAKAACLPSDGGYEHVTTDEFRIFGSVGWPVYRLCHAGARAKRRDRRAHHAAGPCNLAKQRVAV